MFVRRSKLVKAKEPSKPLSSSLFHPLLENSKFEVVTVELAVTKVQPLRSPLEQTMNICSKCTQHRLHYR